MVKSKMVSALLMREIAILERLLSILPAQVLFQELQQLIISSRMVKVLMTMTFLANYLWTVVLHFLKVKPKKKYY